LIAEAKIKTDKNDAKIQARLLRPDMLFTCYVLGEEIRNCREFLRRHGEFPVIKRVFKGSTCW